MRVSIINTHIHLVVSVAMEERVRWRGYVYSCFARGNAYCRAVALYYSGVDGGSHLGGAMAAYYALDDDFSFWGCSKATLAAIDTRDFHAFLVRRR